MAAAKFDRAALSVDGATATYRSSTSGIRHFCRQCGASLFFEFSNMPDEIEILIGSLDDASQIVPTFHGYHDERIAWFEVQDPLPRYSRMP